MILPDRTPPACLDCAATLKPTHKGRTVTGYCRSCWPRHKWTPQSRAKLAATKRSMWAVELADPVKRAVKSEQNKRARAAQTRTPELTAKQIEGRSRNYWCPVEFRPLNALLKRNGFLLAERKQMVATEMLAEAQRLERAANARREAQTPFERQLERVRNGAKLVTVQPLRRAGPDYSITGNSLGML